MKNTEKTMDKIVALCKNRGFVYPGSEASLAPSGSPAALMRKFSPAPAARCPRGRLFAHLPHCTAHKLRTNAKTRHEKYSRMHNLENHSQKGLYKCSFLWYLHISNNSCY